MIPDGLHLKNRRLRPPFTSVFFFFLRTYVRYIYIYRWLLLLSLLNNQSKQTEAVAGATFGGTSVGSRVRRLPPGRFTTRFFDRPVRFRVPCADLHTSMYIQIIQIFEKLEQQRRRIQTIFHPSMNRVAEWLKFFFLVMF